MMRKAGGEEGLLQIAVSLHGDFGLCYRFYTSNLLDLICSYHQIKTI